MITTIYYFSGTGNSLAVARDLAQELGETELIPITRVMHQPEIVDNAGTVGIVFPVYFMDMPGIVKDFVRKLRVPDTAYLFGIATCGQQPGHALFSLSALMERNGRRLSAGFALVMPENYIAPVDLMEPEAIQQQKNENVRKKIPALAAAITQRRVSAPEGTSSLIWRVLGSLSSVMMTSVIRVPKKLHATDACNRCGTCGRICPTNNISVTNDAVTWGGNCAQCYACIHWCPARAIEIGGRTSGKPRYHHPDVTLKDMILR
jgi:ferredoxin